MQSPQNGCVTEAITPISPRAVAVAPALGDLARVVGLDGLERHLGVDAARRSRRAGHDVVHAPAVGVAHVHVLDEAQDVAACRGSGAPCRRLLLVHAALDDHVDLDRRQPAAARRVDALEHPRDREIDVVHARNTASSSESRLTVMRCSPASRSACALRRQQRAVGRQRDVARRRRSRPACATSCSRSRRSSGSPPVRRIFSHAVRRRRRAPAARSPRSQQFAARQEREVAPEDLLAACSRCSGSCSGR